MVKAFILALGFLSTAFAEIGLTVQTNNEKINGMPIRLVNGYLSVGGEGPIFQGFYDYGSLVLSDRVVSEEASGSGIGLDEDGLLIVTFNSSSSFYDRDGWLEFRGKGLFGLKQIGQDYQVYAGRADLEDSNPALIEIAALTYPNSTSHNGI